MHDYGLLHWQYSHALMIESDTPYPRLSLFMPRDCAIHVSASIWPLNYVAWYGLCQREEGQQRLSLPMRCRGLWILV